MSEDLRRLLFLALDPLALTAWALVILNLMLLGRRALGVFRWSFALASALLIVVASPLGANELQGWLEDRARALATCAEPPTGSVLVTLGGGVRKQPMDPSDIAQMEVPSFRRTVEAAHLAMRTPGSILLLSAGGAGRVREADLMASLVTALGIPADRVVEERESRTTFGNALESRSMLTRFPDRPIYLVTSAMHMRRAAATFRSAGLTVCPYPVDFQRMEPEGADALIPSMAALQRTAGSVRELVAFEVYRRQHRIASSSSPLRDPSPLTSGS